MRKPLQGTWNIIRFNYHFYLFALGGLAFLLILDNHVNEGMDLFLNILIWFIVIPTSLSLLVSLYIYDLSGLYKLEWIKQFNVKEKGLIVNINAGFDETSLLLKERFPEAELKVLDFYDPIIHTEVSIKRARKAYPRLQNTEQVKTTALPLEDNSVDSIFLTFSAHEIRDVEERISFFKELNRFLKPDGQIIVTEHLRDIPNLLAYNIGFLHFHSKLSWLETFRSSELKVKKEHKFTPFISTFRLVKNGISS